MQSKDDVEKLQELLQSNKLSMTLESHNEEKDLDTQELVEGMMTLIE
jgi:hypothetical protein